MLLQMGPNLAILWLVELWDEPQREKFVVATLNKVFGLSWSHRCVVGNKQGVARITTQP
jgi:hypothetical protein